MVFYLSGVASSILSSIVHTNSRGLLLLRVPANRSPLHRAFVSLETSESVVCWSGICGLGSQKAEILDPRNMPKFGQKLRFS